MKTMCWIPVAAAILTGLSAGQAAAQDASTRPAASSPFDGVWAVERRRPPPGGPPSGGLGERPPPADSAVASMPESLRSVLDRGDLNVYRQMTPEGRAQFARLDPARLPANNCQSPGLPSIAMTPNLQAWSLSGGVLTIHHEYFDTTRTIPVGQESKPGPATSLGVAAAQIEGRTLTIVTSGFAPRWSGLARNAPSSDALTVRETYTLVDDDTLEGRMTLTDPKYLTRPLNVAMTLKRAPAGTRIETFPCDLEASKRDLK